MRVDFPEPLAPITAVMVRSWTSQTHASNRRRSILVGELELPCFESRALISRTNAGFDSEFPVIGIVNRQRSLSAGCGNRACCRRR